MEELLRPSPFALVTVHTLHTLHLLHLHLLLHTFHLSVHLQAPPNMGDGKVSATLSSPPSPPIPKIPAVTSTVLAAPLASPLPRLPLVTRVALLADLLCIVSVVSLSAPNANCNKQTRDATILSFCSSIAFLFLPSVQRVAMAISPSGINPAVGSKLSPGSPESLTLANWICCSYRQVCICLSNDALHFCVLFSSNNSYYLGAELLRFDSLIGESVLKHLWHHQDAILCCSLKSVPVFIFANQTGLDMLETTLVALQDITWVFRGRQRKLEDTFQKNSNRLKLLGANILVDNKGCIKLADFGASKQVELVI
ncbi:hypothetical protein Ahy_A05g021862 [Arachis hypogaea]|uniref:MEKHLA domain-containing protein n=1 Tax=Arachis hypogaea TaxID=3818 RepID=A0A445CYS9_ARAHY|nr:hypothetical protein Ahy_A05g021862 [Arachis hypogaea]